MGNGCRQVLIIQAKSARLLDNTRDVCGFAPGFGRERGRASMAWSAVYSATLLKGSENRWITAWELGMMPDGYMRHSKIDPALKERRAVIQLLHRVDRPDITYAELEQIAEELLGTGTQAGYILAQEIGKTEDLERLNRLTYLAAYIDDERIVAALSRLLFHPNRSREYKAQVLQSLERLGVDTEHGVYGGFLQRQEVLRLNLVETRRRMQNNAEAAVQFLYDAFYASPGQRLAMARLLLAESDPASTELLAYLVQISEESTWQQVLDMLGRTRTDASVTVLQELIRYAVAPELVASAERALRRLRFAGHPVPEAPQAGPAAHVRTWVSRVEGNGAQMIWMAAPGTGKLADTACFLLHEGRGLIDCFGEAQADLTDFVRASVQVELEDGGRSVPLDYAIDLLERSLGRSMEQGVPMPPELPFRLRRLQLQGLTPRLVPLLELDPIYRQRAEGPELKWPDVCDLFQEPVLDDWIITDPMFFNDVGKFYGRSRLGAVEVRRFVRRVFTEYVQPELPALRERLLRNAQWVEVTGESGALAERLRLAAAVLDAYPVDKNAFLQQFILKSVRDAREMLREGYDPTALLDDEYFD